MNTKKFHGRHSAANLSAVAWLTGLISVLIGAFQLKQIAETDNSYTIAILLMTGLGTMVGGLVIAFLLAGLSALIENSGRIRQLLEQQSGSDEA